MINNVIRGVVTSGSYNGCGVIILNEGYCNELGKIRIVSFSDISKYHVMIESKPVGSNGSKNVGEKTYLFKDSISIVQNCRCETDTCQKSHVNKCAKDAKEVTNDSTMNDSTMNDAAINDSTKEANLFGTTFGTTIPISFQKKYKDFFLVETKQLIDLFVYKYKNNSNVISMAIAFRTLEQKIQDIMMDSFSFTSHMTAFIRMASMSMLTEPPHT